MKTFYSNYRFLLLLFLLVASASVNAQNPCDQCTDPWGPNQSVTLYSQTISSKPSTCLYTFVYTYRERMCNGNLEVKLVSLEINQQNSGMFCSLISPSDCYNSRRAAIRSLVDFIGQPATFSQEKACYAQFEVKPPQDFIDCFLNPGEYVDIWYSFIECDATSCCSITYTPNGDGTVSYVTNSSVACTPGPGPTLPAYLTWECNGQSFTVPVDQNQPVNCTNTCSTGNGMIYKMDDVEPIIAKENRFTVYPNPTDGEITLDCSTIEMDQLEIVVLNVQGQEIQRKVLQVANGSASITLNTNEWSAGIYTMRIQGNGELLETQRIQVSE